MSLADAFVESEAAYANAVIASTWGHLAPKPRMVYPGTLLFTLGEYGDITPIRSNFGDLPDSPWFFEHMQEFIRDKCTERRFWHNNQYVTRPARVKHGEVALFTGTYRMFKNGKARFSGKVKIVKIA